MPQIQRVRLVRHAETMGADTTYVGDPTLTHRGERQSTLTADHLHDVGVSSVYVSPLLRAKQTAAPLITRLGAPPKTLPLMAEIDLGDFPGPEASGRKRPLIDFGDWGGDYGADFSESVIRGFGDFISEVQPLEHEDIALISHGGTINVILDHVQGIPWDGQMRNLLANCSVSTIEISPGSVSLSDINFVRHLPYELITPENERPLKQPPSR
ncbi:MAG: histidine phosphatase family protein [Chloroflexi bacterium]|nr:histidine phosphatase family protein [Chloroflexota bacterium]